VTPNHYDQLGVRPEADEAQIRTAYRRMVLKYHPDRNKDPRATETFLRVTEAYETLSDPERRKRYDAILGRKAPPATPPPPTEPTLKPKPTAKAAPKPVPKPSTSPPKGANVGLDPREEALRLTNLLALSRYADAERLAQTMVKGKRGAGLPHAVLGDIARHRGELRTAAGHYAFAVQADPRNPLYQRRYEEMLTAIHRRVPTSVSPTGAEAAPTAPLFAGATLVLFSSLYVALATTEPAIGGPAMIATWTLGLVMALFVAGLSMGVALAISRQVDAFSTTHGGSAGSLSPSVLLGFIALANFWVAAALYLVVGASQQAFNRSTSRMVMGTALATVMFALASSVHGGIAPIQTLLWGGNLVYLGTLMGWLVADGLRP